MYDQQTGQTPCNNVLLYYALMGTSDSDLKYACSRIKYLRFN
jgi:hypothetical protein